MSRRRWAVIAAAVSVAAAVAVVAPRTGWLQARPRFTSVPGCAAIMTWPAMVAAARTAVGPFWEERRTSYGDLRDLKSCTILVTPQIGAVDHPEAETPWDRRLQVLLFLTREEWDSARSPIFLRGGVGEAGERFQQERRKECQTEASSTGLADEPDLGDEAYSCWTTSSGTPERHLGFRASNLSVSVELSGTDFTPPSSFLQDTPALRADLEQNTRCVAEVLAAQFDVQVGQKHTCGRGTPQSM